MLLTLVHLFAEMYRKVDFYRQKFFVLSHFLCSNTQPQKTRYSVSLSCFCNIKFPKECSIMFCSAPKNLVHASTVKMAARFVVIQCKILHSESTPGVPLMQNRAQSTIRNRAKSTNQQRSSLEKTLTGRKPVQLRALSQHCSEAVF